MRDILMLVTSELVFLLGMLVGIYLRFSFLIGWFDILLRLWMLATIFGFANCLTDCTGTRNE